MAALNFPDPNVTTSYTNPDTGITYEWANGVWKSVSSALTAPELFVDVEGDNLTGNLTLGTDKIVLNATDGSATFAGSVATTGSGYFIARNSGNGGCYLYNDGTLVPHALLISNNNSSTGETIRLNYDGSATFAGRLNVNDASQIYRPTSAGGDVGGNSLFTLKSDAVGTNQTVAAINCDGSASFASNVSIGNLAAEALLTIYPGTNSATAIGGRDINYGANLISSSGRSGYTVRVANAFTNDDDNAGFMWLYPFDTGGNNDNKVIRSATGATLVDKFWVNQAGGAYFATKVGIGTQDPSQLVEIASTAPNIRFTDTIYGHSEIDGNSANLKFNADKGNAKADSNISFFIDNQHRMQIDSAGRLLVGTSNSSGLGATLQVIGDTAGQFHRGVNDASGAGIAISKSRSTTYGSYNIVQDNDLIGAVTFRADDGTDYNSTAALVGCHVDGTPGSNDMPGRLVFATTTPGGSSPTERMRIDSEGRVGIGTDLPSTALDIADELTFSAGGPGWRSAAIKGIDEGGSFKGSLAFYTHPTAGAAGAPDERMRIDSSGNVGIGTQNPQAINGYTVLTLNNSTQGGAIEFKRSNTSYGRLLQASDAVILETKQNIPLVFGTGNVSTERMRITSSGELLVGRTNEANMNVNIACANAFIGAHFIGMVHDSTNSNNRTTLVHKMNTDQGFMFSGNLVVQSWTGNAFITVHVTKIYNSHAIEVDIIHATHSAQMTRSNVRVVTAKYGSEIYLGFQKAGGGTGVMYINAFLNGNIDLNGGVREVNNTSLGDVTEIARLNY